jgi:hypothetical protein
LSLVGGAAGSLSLVGAAGSLSLVGGAAGSLSLAGGADGRLPLVGAAGRGGSWVSREVGAGADGSAFGSSSTTETSSMSASTKVDSVDTGGGGLLKRTGGEGRATAGTYAGGGGGSLPACAGGADGGPLSSNACWTATMNRGGGGMLGTTPLAEASALETSSGTSRAGFQSVHPGRHTGVLGAMTPPARAARNSSVRTALCCPVGSAQRHSSSVLTGYLCAP